MYGVLKIAYKLLTNDKAKFPAFLVGITFPVLLMIQTTSFFSGVPNQAEASLHVASAGIGVATAARPPGPTLDGSFGVANSGTSGLIGARSPFWSFGARPRRTRRRLVEDAMPDPRPSAHA